MTGRGSRAWLLYLLAGITATGGYFLLPSSTAQNIFIILVDASVITAITAGILSLYIDRAIRYPGTFLPSVRC